MQVLGLLGGPAVAEDAHRRAHRESLGQGAEHLADAGGRRLEVCGRQCRARRVSRDRLTVRLCRRECLRMSTMIAMTSSARSRAVVIGNLSLIRVAMGS